MQAAAWAAVRVLAWCFWSLLLSIVFATVVTVWGYMLIVHWHLFPELMQ